MATEKRWTPYEYSPYAKEFRRDDGWQLFYVKPASAPFHWKVLMPGGIAPPRDIKIPTKNWASIRLLKPKIGPTNSSVISRTDSGGALPVGSSKMPSHPS